MPLPMRNSSIRIKLADAGLGDSLPTIRPGAVLYGQVEYKPPSVEKLSALTVCLLGKLVVKGPKKVREVTQVFGVQHAILRNEDEPVELDARIHRFPFHFVIPWTTEYDRTGTYMDDPHNRFTEQPHRVPPSLGSKAKGDAQICYSCYAVGRRKGMRLNEFTPMADVSRGEEIEDIQCIVELPETPYRATNTITLTLNPPSSRVATGLFRRPSTVNLEHYSSFGSLDITLSAPKIVTPGETFSVQAKLRSGQESTGSMSGYSWLLSVKNVELLTKTYRRVKGASEVWSEIGAMALTVTQTPIRLKVGNEIEFDIVIPRTNITTSFKSYTISCLHALRYNCLNIVETDTGKTESEESMKLEMEIEIVRVGDSLSRRFSSTNPADINGERIKPPAYEESPLYQE